MPESPKPSPSTNAERCRKYREKVKADSERRKAYLEKKRIDNQLYKARKPEITDEQQKRRRELNRKAQQRRRARLNGAVTTSPKQIARNDHVGTATAGRAAKPADDKQQNAGLRQQERCTKMPKKQNQEENEKDMFQYYKQKEIRQQEQQNKKTNKIELDSLFNGMHKQIKKSRRKLILIKPDFLKKNYGQRHGQDSPGKKRLFKDIIDLCIKESSLGV